MTGQFGTDAALLSAVRSFAQRVESGTTKKIITRLLQLTPSSDQDERLAALSIATPGEAAAKIGKLWSAWTKTPEVTPQALAWALAAAEATDARHRSSTQVDLVWTGPVGQASTFRRTDQALLEVIERAERRLLVVSFAVYRIEAVERALIAALDRNVSVQLVLETGASSGGKYDGDPFAVLDPTLATNAEILVWPLEKRPRAQSKAGDAIWGLLHAKCALADEHSLFVSSANLTGAALELNIELGVLVEGGSLPRQVAAHFSELVQHGLLARQLPRVSR